MRLYLRAALFGEGPSDYQFLQRLLDRQIEATAAQLLPGLVDIGETLGVDAPRGTPGRRADRILAAAQANADLFDFLVIHSDGAGDPEGARATCVDPGIAALAALATPIPAIACVPVREIEAWMLVDREPFRQFLGKQAEPGLPADPEREPDPKATLRHLLKEGGAWGRRGRESIPYELFGEFVGLDALMRLPAYRWFAEDLASLIERLARARGHRPQPR